jgi:hypothetical protein
MGKRVQSLQPSLGLHAQSLPLKEKPLSRLPQAKIGFFLIQPMKMGFVPLRLSKLRIALPLQDKGYTGKLRLRHARRRMPAGL